MITTYELISGGDMESYEEFSKRVFAMLNQRLNEPRAIMFKVTLTDEAPPGMSIIPFGKDKIAAVQTRWRVEPGNSAFLNGANLLGAYTVTEEFPVSYDRNWPIGHRTPGVCLLTLFRKRPDINRETFLDRWHNGHTPLSLRIHPLWHYSRNVVESAAVPDGMELDGIVEEHTRTRNELLNPFIFFGGPLSMLPNMIRTYLDVRSFLEYSSITPYLTSEYYLKDETLQ